MEFFRDQAAEQFERHTHSAWRPRSGSMVNHRTLTSAMIDSRDFLAAKRRAENEVLLPAGPKIGFTGGIDFNDHRLIWDKLDKVHAKHPDMVLLHGGSPKGAERIAACWADDRKVPQIAFKPDWTRHAKAAPFKRNDQMLTVIPIGVIVFPGTGIQDNLADKARSSASRSGSSASLPRRRTRAARKRRHKSPPLSTRRGTRFSQRRRRVMRPLSDCGLVDPRGSVSGGQAEVRTARKNLLLVSNWRGPRPKLAGGTTSRLLKRG